MGKIFCLMGKSSTGKDTIYKMLMEQKDLSLRTIVPYTTRPIRAGETEGVEYHFIDADKLEELSSHIIEVRKYNTVYGIWSYATIDDGQIDLLQQDYLVIGTLESYEQIRKYYGNEQIIPIYIEVDDGVRLQRALDRERMQDEPKYTELCRRFLADATDFAEAKILAAGITKRFVNEDLHQTVEKITAFMLSCKDR